MERASELASKEWSIEIVKARKFKSNKRIIINKYTLDLEVQPNKTHCFIYLSPLIGIHSGVQYSSKGKIS